MTTENFNPKKPNAGAHSYLNAQKSGFAFCHAEKKHDKITETKDKEIEGMEEKPSPFKVILSTVCIGIGIILGIIEGKNIQSSLIGSTGFDNTTGYLIGAAFAAMGLITGELLSSGLKVDSFTGKKRPTGRWYVGLLLTIIYVGGQGYLAYRAGMGVGDDMAATAHTMNMFIVGVAIIEVLFGFLFLKTAIQIVTLFITNIRLKFILRVMNNTSRQTEQWFQRHVFETNSYNEVHNSNTPTGEETEAIQRARAFYNSGGIH